MLFGCDLVREQDKLTAKSNQNNLIAKFFLVEMKKKLFSVKITENLRMNHPKIPQLSVSLTVCWHRNASISRNEYRLSLSNELSGVLLRRFKKQEMGWQRLWVVYTNFSLFFFKRTSDDHSLASLPIIGYKISAANKESDNITKDHVFKLQFKAHVYFFAADSEHSFNRWISSIRNTSMGGDDGSGGALKGNNRKSVVL